eukprot:Skav203629  [mRNA]  locus=scaffold935:952418:955477:+ [translate_table: standard]
MAALCLALLFLLPVKGMTWSLKKACLFLTLMLPVAGMTWSLQEALLLCGCVLPATGMPWWRIRVWDNRFFYAHASGWWDELPDWEQESLQEAFYWEPEMAVYIYGHSQTCHFDEWAPVWNQDAREWQTSRTRPGPDQFEAQEIDLEDFWRSARGHHGTPASSSWEKPAKAKRPAWSEGRYAARGYASAERRMKKRFLQRAGKEVPEELKPVKAELASEIKRQMKALWLKAKKVEEAENESQLPDLQESEEVDSSESQDTRDPSMESSSSCSEPGKADRRGGGRPTLGLPRSLSRPGKKGPRVTLAPVPEEEPAKAKKPAKAEKKEKAAERPGPSKEPQPKVDASNGKEKKTVKKEPVTPKAVGKKRKPAKAAGETDSEEPAKASSSKPEKAGPEKPAKAKPLEAPSKQQWNDVHYQLKKLRKSGQKPEMVKVFDEAEGGLAKRQWYYQMFLLDPTCSSKEVHKSSLERLTTENTNLKGWVSKWDVGKMQGADPQLPNFEELRDAACEGLKSRPHEVKQWADRGIRQYFLVKAQLTAEKHSNEAVTQAKQRVDLDEERFALCEQALLPEAAGPKQVLLGNKQKPGKALTEEAEEEKPQESLQEAYLRQLEGLQKASKSMGKAVDNLLLLQAGLQQHQKGSPSTMLTAILEETNKLVKRYEACKGSWTQKVSTFQVDLPEDENERSQKVAEVKADKESCETELKELSKAVNPHKLWAKNEGITA